MIEINLIPDVKQELLKAQRTRAQVISGSILMSFIAGGVVVALILYVFGVQTVRSAILDNEIKDGSNKLAQVQDLSKILTIQNQLTKISELNSQKNMDSRLFDVLSAVIPPAPDSVQISQIDVNNDPTASDGMTIKLQGQTASYDTMEVFKKTIDNAVVQFTQNGQQQTVKLASNISTSDVSYGADTTNTKVLRFTLSFTYAQELFSPSTTSPTVKLDINGNVTDSYLGIPKSIFTQRAGDTTQ
ncbi:MAG TPA: hypothetical protein VN081_06230 [Dongiaceae bacterium]|nr:hypothetical protein [Dongiaceae bacterium]